MKKETILNMRIYYRVIKKYPEKKKRFLTKKQASISLHVISLSTATMI